MMKKFTIGLFAFVLIGSLLAGFSVNYSNPIPALSTLTGLEKSLNTSASNLARSFNPPQPPIAYLIDNCKVSNPCLYDFTDFFNNVIWYINKGIEVVIFAINLISLLLIGLGVIIYALFGFMPSLFLSMNLGGFQWLFMAGYGLLSILIAIYGFYILSHILSRSPIKL